MLLAYSNHFFYKGQSMKFCVFCGSNKGSNPHFEQETRALARLIVSQDDEIIYGGGAQGLMGVLAEETLKQGGAITGVIPSFLVQLEGAYPHLTSYYEVETISERIQIMMDKADALILLPGGFGSLEEFFIALTSSELNLHQKPLVIINVDGYYDPLFALFDQVVEKRFAPADDRDFIVTIEHSADLYEHLKNFSYHAVNKRLDESQEDSSL